MKGKRLILIPGFLIIWVNAYSQLNPANLTIVSDVEATEIYDVLPDSRGNIWIAAQSGLMRYDGYEVIRYYPDPRDTNTIGDLLTYSLFEDGKGNIWIGGYNFVSVYNPNKRTFTNYPFAHLTDYPDYAQPQVWSISEDGSGRIFFGVWSGMGFKGGNAVIYFDPLDNKLSRLEHPNSNILDNIFSLSTDPNGNVLASGKRGVFTIDSDLAVLETKIPGALKVEDQDQVGPVYADSEGFLWMESNQSTLCRINMENGRFQTWSMAELFPYEPRELRVNRIVEDAQSNIWMATTFGLVFFHREREVFEVFDYAATKKVQQGVIFGLRFDSFGDLWFGSLSEGLMRYSKKSIFNAFSPGMGNPKTFGNGWASKILELNDGSVWVSSVYTGLNTLNRVNPIDGRVIEKYDGDSLAGRLVGEYPSGKLLMENENEYFAFDPLQSRVQSLELPEGIQTPHIFNVSVDPNGNAYFCSVDGLFIQNQGDGSVVHIDMQNLAGSDFASNEVTKIWKSNKNGIWLLTNNGLFLHNSKTKETKRLANNPEEGDILPSQDINSFYEEENGKIWVGTWQGGLSMYLPEDGSIKTYTVEDGMPSSSIQGILGDDENQVLWISTFNGLCSFDIRQNKFTNYTTNDGIHGLLFADGASVKTKDRYFLFGGNNGVTYFHPDDFSVASAPPLVSLLSLKIGEEMIDLTNRTSAKAGDEGINNLHLAYDQNGFSIAYTGIQYDNPRKNKFAYKLENYDSDWREVDHSRTAFYYDLPPGKYTFRVKAANSNSIWSDGSTTLSLEISSPWWLTWWAYIAYALIGILAIVGIGKYIQKRNIEKLRTAAKDKELAQAREIEKAYAELKSTQAQLIQSEKMASLGELTAGIAHEIQNPLNFVNNFSEVSSELLDEATEELVKTQDPSSPEKATSDHREVISEALTILGDVKQNLEKITYHGKRADAIVKGMRAHSRSGKGEKQPTDINALAEEYLKLSYHGLRAKDKSFNADFKTDFDPNLPKVNVVPQDIGRVLLNLINNAFQAVCERSKSEGGDYKPTVTVKTERSTNNALRITITDNGSGIPDDIKDKIFQPFFTTKPTGQGTGLGLSLSYDIIKAHGGEITCKSGVGKGLPVDEAGTEFIIKLPRRS